MAVWVGYDNADRKRRSLGSSETGASVALPIFQPIIEAIWARKVAPKAPLSGPSPEAQRRLVDVAIDYQSGDRVRSSRGVLEHFRLGEDNKLHDTQYQIVSGQSSDNERSAKHTEGSAKHTEGSARNEKRNDSIQRTSAHRNGSLQAKGWGSRSRPQARDYSQVRGYYNYWQPQVRGQNAGYLSGEHWP